MAPIVTLLREGAAVLFEYSETRAAGVLTWDGTAYKPAKVGKTGDLQAAKWWAILSTLAEFLALQKTPLTEEQRGYLLHRLCGGMGSFNDFILSEASNVGAHQANAKLSQIRARMLELLQSPPP